MRAFRKFLLLMLPVCGFAIFIAGHIADDHSFLGSAGSGVSFLFFLATLVVAFLPERETATIVEVDGPKPAPRTLSRDVLNDASLSMTLPQRIEAAIELSKIVSRAFGILSIRIDDMDAVAQHMELGTAEDAIAKISSALRKTLRSTDRAIGVDGEEILICLPLIAVRSDLNAISARLSRAVARTIAGQTSDASRAFVPAIDIGIAMHPIDGYRAQDLIESAQAHSREARAFRLGRPTISSTPAIPAPVPARKARVTRSRKAATAPAR